LCHDLLRSFFCVALHTQAPPAAQDDGGYATVPPSPRAPSPAQEDGAFATVCDGMSEVSEAPEALGEYRVEDIMATKPPSFWRTQNAMLTAPAALERQECIFGEQLGPTSPALAPVGFVGQVGL